MFEPTYGWSERTAPEIRTLADADGSIVVVPIGSIEQHGNHLPVVTDTLLTNHVVRGAVDRVSESVPVLETPPVWIGCSQHHLEFGGTLSVELETFLSVLANVADTALQNGFEGLLLVNGHGGNRAALGCAVSEIGADHSAVSVSGLTYFELAAPFVDEIRDSEFGGMAHGGEFETSLMLHLEPDAVRTNELEGSMLSDPAERGLVDMFEAGPLSTYRPFSEFSETGAIGDPKLATAEKGKRLFEGIVEELADTLRGMHRRTSSTQYD
jgi:creatinine amidohydrolase